MTRAISVDAFITSIEARLGCIYTDEQRDLIKEFDKPIICFASPGTGKTHTAIAGLLTAELLKGIPGENIYALSFTKMATGELSVRHKAACDKLGVGQYVNFKTLHALCAQLLKENYRYFNLSSLETGDSMPIKDAVEYILDVCSEHGDRMTPQMARNIVNACRSLNSALIFDEDNVKSKIQFKNTHCSYELFTYLRKQLFLLPMYTGKVPVDSIMLYALALMIKHPEVSAEFKSKCRLMLVDEAQDLSLLHLRIISLLTDNAILIGDMKQQIYAFNGACQEIVEQYYRLYPDALTKELTQSFRCKNEVIEWANKVIWYNGIAGNEAKGTGNGGQVLLLNQLPLDDLAKSFHDDYYSNRRMFTRDTLFLFRNNASSIPIAEALYKQKVPFRVNKYQPATELPVIKEMVELLNLCRNPYNVNYVGALQYLIPELRGYRLLKDNPIYQACSANTCSVFELNYIFKDMAVGSAAMQLLFEISEKMREGALVSDMFNMLWPMYNSQWQHQREWMLEYSSSYYIMIANSAIKDKTYDKFLRDEAEKAKYIQENIDHNRGIRCYTMHASKGLEADDVYILDADPDIIPNNNKLSKMVEAHSELDAAREVRNERSLCFVAITRAKDNVYISSLGEPAPMLVGENIFKVYDDYFDTLHMYSDDIGAFNEFIEGGIK